MNRNFRASAAVTAWLVCGAPAMAQHHWGYSGEGAPPHWGKLDAKYAMCANGRNQSPIDLAKFTKSDLQPVRLDYKTGASEILNNGHTVQVNYQPGSSLSLDGRRFELKQFHFHAPSENTFEGKHFPMEGHLVHADKEGNLAVVAVMFTEGSAHPFITSLWKAMPGNAGDKKPLPAPLNVAELLPLERDYYRFDGSLTTPPCSEGVRWLVMKKPVAASRAQIESFSKTLGFANNRPVQPLNARQVLSRP